MKTSLFLAFALLTGFIATSAIDTSKRLQSIEKQNLAIIERLTESEKRIIHFVTEASFEAQQAKMMATDSNEKLFTIRQVAGSTEGLMMRNMTTLNEQGKKIDALQSMALLQSVKSTPRTTTSAPPFKPSEKIDLGNGYEERIKEQQARDSVQALEGIRDELQRRRIDSIIK